MSSNPDYTKLIERAPKRRQRSRGRHAKKRTVPKMKIALWSCVVILACVASYFGFKALTTAEDYVKGQTTYDKIADVANVDPNQFSGVINFAALKAMNPDIQGWIYQKNTVINYPIVMGQDNVKYLHTLFNGKKGNGGTLFCDAKGARDFAEFNTIVYGHHMRDGSMFKSLRGYVHDKNYYANHKRFEFITPTNKYHLLVFSAYITKADGATYQLTYPDAQSKSDYLKMARSKSRISADSVKVTAEDKIITLSTCAYEYDNARYVVLGKLEPWTQAEISEGEKAQELFDRQKEKTQEKKKFLGLF